MSTELWDRADYGYKKEDDPYQVFFITYSRYLLKGEFLYSFKHRNYVIPIVCIIKL